MPGPTPATRSDRASYLDSDPSSDRSAHLGSSFSSDAASCLLAAASPDSALRSSALCGSQTSLVTQNAGASSDAEVWSGSNPMQILLSHLEASRVLSPYLRSQQPCDGLAGPPLDSEGQDGSQAGSRGGLQAACKKQVGLPARASSQGLSRRARLKALARQTPSRAPTPIEQASIGAGPCAAEQSPAGAGTRAVQLSAVRAGQRARALQKSPAGAAARARAAQLSSAVAKPRSSCGLSMKPASTAGGTGGLHPQGTITPALASHSRTDSAAAQTTSADLGFRKQASADLALSRHSRLGCEPPVTAEVRAVRRSLWAEPRGTSHSG